MHIAHYKHRAFTLIELLLAIGIIGILSTIVIIAVGPSRVLNMAYDLRNQSNSRQLENAIIQLMIQEGLPPELSSLPGTAEKALPICHPTNTHGSGSCIILSSLVPDYIPAIPVNGEEENEYYSGYLVHQENNRIFVTAGRYGIVGWWKLNGDAKDSTSNENHGTVLGATPTTDRHGKIDGALSFNAGNRINLPSAFQNISNSTTLTLSIWVKHNTTTPGANRYVTITRIHNGSAYILWSGPSHRYQLTYPISTNSLATIESTFVTTNWTHIVGVRNGANVSLYVNGVLSNSASNANNPTINSPVNAVIGRSPFSDTERFVGSLDDVRIYDRALTAAEVKALYESYTP